MHQTCALYNAFPSSTAVPFALVGTPPRFRRRMRASKATNTSDIAALAEVLLLIEAPTSTFSLASSPSCCKASMAASSPWVAAWCKWAAASVDLHTSIKKKDGVG